MMTSAVFAAMTSADCALSLAAAGGCGLLVRFFGAQIGVFLLRDAAHQVVENAVHVEPRLRRGLHVRHLPLSRTILRRL